MCSVLSQVPLNAYCNRQEMGGEDSNSEKKGNRTISNKKTQGTHVKGFQLFE